MEYQAKELFAKHGVTTTLGTVVTTPEEDIPLLEEIGVAKVFTPGAPTTEITGWVASHFAD